MSTESYCRETPDIETSADDYASRFAGPVGDWFLQVQAAAAIDLLGVPVGSTVLDVGGGHGQLAYPLHGAGYRVSVLGSDETCRRRIDALVQAQSCRFYVGDLLHLPFADQSFDAVVAFRLISHLDDWQRLLAEMARVSRQEIIVEYPELVSVNLLSAATWELKRAIEGNTRPFRCFRRRQLLNELRAMGWEANGHYAEFMLPMVLHRVLGRVRVSSRAEAICRALGVTQKLGSPVLLRAVKG